MESLVIVLSKPDEEGVIMEITIDSISKHYGNYQALRDINLHVNNGELVALLGPSGSGKTSLLRVIA